MGVIISRPAGARHINQLVEATMKAKSVKLFSGNRACHAEAWRRRVGCGSITRRAVDLIGWIVPSAILALVPKCPMCFAAYIALWTGIGLSFSAAIYVRASVLVVCVGLIVFLAARNVRRLIHKFCQCETIIGRNEPC
jgi:hypothetical protein